MGASGRFSSATSDAAMTLPRGMSVAGDRAAERSVHLDIAPKHARPQEPVLRGRHPVYAQFAVGRRDVLRRRNDVDEGVVRFPGNLCLDETPQVFGDHFFGEFDPQGFGDHAGRAGDVNVVVAESGVFDARGEQRSVEALDSAGNGGRSHGDRGEGFGVFAGDFGHVAQQHRRAFDVCFRFQGHGVRRISSGGRQGDQQGNAHAACMPRDASRVPAHHELRLLGPITVARCLRFAAFRRRFE